MKIVLTRDDVREILLRHVFGNWSGSLEVNNKDEIGFNDHMISYYDLIFEKKRVLEVKLEDVEDMVIEQLKVARQEE